MPRSVLDDDHVHPSIRDKLATVHPLVREVQAALVRHPVVVVGMAGNPFCKKARTLLAGTRQTFEYLEYGSYLSRWRERTALKLWTGWPTLPMVFVRGMLIGGFDDLQRLVQSGELQRLVKGQ